MTEAAAARPFGGVRILDLTTDLGVYATRLFADLGADVVRIETEEYDRSSYAWQYRNASKTVVRAAADQFASLEALLGEAKSARMVIVEREHPAFAFAAALLADDPSRVVVQVSPWGATGPLADAPYSDLVLQAAGGIAWMSGRAGEPPLRLPFEQSGYVTSVYAAVVAGIALHDAEMHGIGHLIDVSAQECIAHSLQNAIQVYDLERIVSQRGGEGTRDCSENMFECSDGHIFLAAGSMVSTAWQSIIEWMGESSHPSAEEFRQPRWRDARWRMTAEAKEEFRRIFEAFSRGIDRATFRSEAIRRKLIIAPVSRIAELFDNDQLNFVSFFKRVELNNPLPAVTFPGAPYEFSEPVWSVRPAREARA